jgi:hypothetical protein
MPKQFQVDTGGTLLTGLVSYFKFEDATDFYGSNPLTNVSATFVAGKVANCANLVKASSQYFWAADSASLSITGSLSFAGWVNFASVPSGGDHAHFFSKNDGASESYRFMFSGDSNALRWISSTSGSYQAGNDLSVAWTPSTATWYHIACTFDAAVPEVRFYVSASLQGSAQAAAGATLFDNAKKLGVGATSIDSTPGNFLNGKMDEWGIWSNKLSTTEIADLYNSGNGQTMVLPSSGPEVGRVMSQPSSHWFPSIVSY